MVLRDSVTFRVVLRFFWGVFVGSKLFYKFLKLLRHSLMFWDVLRLSKHYNSFGAVLKVSWRFWGVLWSSGVSWGYLIDCEQLRNVSEGSEVFSDVLRCSKMFWSVLNRPCLFWAVLKCSWRFGDILWYSVIFWDVPRILHGFSAV